MFKELILGVILLFLVGILRGHHHLLLISFALTLTAFLRPLLVLIYSPRVRRLRFSRSSYRLLCYHHTIKHQRSHILIILSQVWIELFLEELCQQMKLILCCIIYVFVSNLSDNLEQLVKKWDMSLPWMPWKNPYMWILYSRSQTFRHPQSR